MADVAINTDAPAKDASVAPEGATVDTMTGTVRLDTDKATAAAKKEEPALIGGKFKSQDELLKAYQELEKMKGAPVKEEPKAPVKAEPAKDAAPELTEAQKIIAEKLTGEIQQIAGGENEYKALLEWAQTNKSAAEVKAFDAAIASGDPELAKFAVKGLNADYSAAVGREGTLVGGGAAPGTAGIVPFASTEEMVRAMQDPRYRNDPAFVADVQKRVAVSKALW